MWLAGLEPKSQSRSDVAPDSSDLPRNRWRTRDHSRLYKDEDVRGQHVKQGPLRVSRLTYQYAGEPHCGATDGDLLDRWVAYRDEAAFELLVRRHTHLVLAACRRLLRDSNDADDAFQATFLVLARRAISISRSEVLPAWLHRVAFRAALRIRGERVRRSAREVSDVETLAAMASPETSRAELNFVLDEEIARLPARHRAVFVLCCLEGKTGEEAGRVLGCPAGTVSSRLTRAARSSDIDSCRGDSPLLS